MTMASTQYTIAIDMIAGNYGEEGPPPSLLRVVSVIDATPEPVQIMEAVAKAREVWDAAFEGRERDGLTVIVDPYGVRGSTEAVGQMAVPFE